MTTLSFKTAPGLVLGLFQFSFPQSWVCLIFHGLGGILIATFITTHLASGVVNIINSVHLPP